MKEKLSALPVSELREIAKEKGIKGVSSLRKQQLVDMLAELDTKLLQVSWKFARMVTDS